MSDGRGDLRCFLPKNRALGHPTKALSDGHAEKGASERHLAGHGQESATGHPRGGSPKTLVGAELLVGSARGNLLNVPLGKGLLQLGQVNGRGLNADPMAGLVRPRVRGDLPQEPGEGNPQVGGPKKGGSVAEAIRISRMGSFQRRVAVFKNKFFAATSARSRASKRSEIIKLAKAVKGSDNILPLNKDLVEGVAAALKESGMKSGSQYLVELKLMHIEAGYEVEAWLKRTLDLCKKALERARGPTIRAMEVKIATWAPEDLEASARGKGTPQYPKLAFAWSAVWMLREIELRRMKIQDVTFPGPERWVTVWLPTSKTDQQGKGIRRTLRCCGKSPCATLCPWALGWKAIEAARAKNALLGSPLFSPAGNLKAISKSGTIKAWKAHMGRDVSGHSARRSGAMYYVRAGLPIQELAFLCRWKSNVVLSYAEEALQERAVFVPDLHGTQESSQTGAPMTPSNVTKDPTESLRAPSTPAWTVMKMGEDQVEPNMGLAQSLKSPRDLWVVTKGRGWRGRPRHLVLKASWNLPMSEWTTACGISLTSPLTSTSFQVQCRTR
jgi:hypothetical protein